MDFVPIDLENSSIIGETYGTMLLLESKGTFNGQIISIQDRCVTEMAENIL